MRPEERLQGIAPLLLPWYDANRRALPWRQSPDPYRVWVSEIMLQQTRVAAVIPYYTRFMAELPTVEHLAQVPQERLMKLWEGLGYYSRARNLQRAAKVICTDWNGAFPRTAEELMKLPGIGAYTAGAIASIAFGQPVPAVDGNVLRVAARVGGVEEDVLDPAVVKKFRLWMTEAVPRDRPGAFNQALMDLGAMVCLPKGTPDCAACPLKDLCAARETGCQERLPLRRKKAPRRREELTVYVLLREERVALRRRPEQGLLAGLWEFPHVSGRLAEEEAAAPLALWGLSPLEWRRRLTTRHIFTHVEWEMTGYVAEVRGEESGGLIWVDREGLADHALPSAFGRFLEAAEEELRRLEGKERQ